MGIGQWDEMHLNKRVLGLCHLQANQEGGKLQLRPELATQKRWLQSTGAKLQHQMSKSASQRGQEKHAQGGSLHCCIAASYKGGCSGISLNRAELR